MPPKKSAPARSFGGKKAPAAKKNEKPVAPSETKAEVDTTPAGAEEEAVNVNGKEEQDDNGDVPDVSRTEEAQGVENGVVNGEDEDLAEGVQQNENGAGENGTTEEVEAEAEQQTTEVPSTQVDGPQEEQVEVNEQQHNGNTTETSQADRVAPSETPAETEAPTPVVPSGPVAAVPAVAEVVIATAAVDEAPSTETKQQLKDSRSPSPNGEGLPEFRPRHHVDPNLAIAMTANYTQQSFHRATGPLQYTIKEAADTNKQVQAKVATGNQQLQLMNQQLQGVEATFSKLPLYTEKLIKMRKNMTTIDANIKKLRQQAMDIKTEVDQVMGPKLHPVNRR